LSRNTLSEKTFIEGDLVRTKFDQKLVKSLTPN